jgi:hypothetical protein
MIEKYISINSLKDKKMRIIIDKYERKGYEKI